MLNIFHGAPQHGQQAQDTVEARLGRPLTPQEQHLVSLEGFSHGYYLDSEGVPTRGVGQTGEYMHQSFPETAQHFIEKTQGLVPAYNELPEYLQLRLFDSTYRGGLSGSPLTLEHINAGRWDQAATEFLNNQEYRDAVATGSGVAPRMEATAAAMRQYGQELQAAQQQEPQVQQEAPQDEGWFSSIDSISDYLFGHEGGSVTVQKGDTLTSLADTYRTTVPELQNINEIPNPNQISIGQKIQIPESPSGFSKDLDNLMTKLFGD